MPTVLITGAGRGLGLEFAKQYLNDGWKVLVTIRNPMAGHVFANVSGDLQVHILDINAHLSVEKLARDLEGQAIDLLINNAGIYGEKDVEPADTDYKLWHQVMETNVFAPFKFTTTFLPLIQQSQLKKVATIGSSMGSMGNTDQGGGYMYRSSKAAVHSVMKTLAENHREDGVTFVLLHPGWVQTDMGGEEADIDVVESVSGMRTVIENTSLAQTGSFFRYDGTTVPW